MMRDESIILHLESLPEDVRMIFDIFSDKDIVSNFYLAGGTAVALYYGHRISRDFDFFSNKKFDNTSLVHELESLNTWEGLISEPNTLLGTFGGVKTSFFTLPYDLLENPFGYKRLFLARPLDLALMKILAISDRGTKRDFVDLYVLSQKVKPLSELLKDFPKKYGKWRYNLAHIIRSLVYFEDAEKDIMPTVFIDLNWKDVKKFFIEQSKILAKEFLGV